MTASPPILLAVTARRPLSAESVAVSFPDPKGDVGARDGTTTRRNGNHL